MARLRYEHDVHRSVCLFVCLSVCNAILVAYLSVYCSSNSARFVNDAITTVYLASIVAIRG